MKEIKNFILLVDSHCPYKHNTKGRYRVAAKSEKEAVQLLRKKIGFGSIQVYYECKQNDYPQLLYKCVKKEIYNSNTNTTSYIDAIHATAPRSKKKIRP